MISIFLPATIAVDLVNRDLDPRWPSSPKTVNGPFEGRQDADLERVVGDDAVGVTGPSPSPGRASETFCDVSFHTFLPWLIESAVSFLSDTAARTAGLEPKSAHLPP